MVTCNKKHDHVEFCFQCSSYPCERYEKIGGADSFITYRNVLSDLEKVKQDGIESYAAMLNEKIEILDLLINNYNDGRSKNFYCIAVNLLELDPLRDVMRTIREEIGISEKSTQEKVREIRTLLEARAAEAGLELKLRK